MLEEGAVAPDFTLPAEGGASIALAGFAAARRALLLPQGRHGRMHRRGRRLFTAARPLCARRHRRRRPLARYGRQPRQVPQKHGLSIPLAADVDKAAAEAYGVWVEKSMYGRRFMGVERTTVLIGAQGRIARIWRKVKVPGHAETCSPPPALA